MERVLHSLVERGAIDFDGASSTRRLRTPIATSA
jgi:hypothetical protein